ncbi:MAG TPA: hypothetical protein VMV45_06615 [Casimicrobiaceae bacterium]|nr:hypothetical protein [Casimicrobiaceae bacterium]
MPGKFPNPSCQFFEDGNFGRLAPGAYSVNWLVQRADGTTLASGDTSFNVEARGDRCNPDPTHNLVGVSLASNDPAAFIARLQSDPAYRESLGDVNLITSISTPTSRFRR